MRGKIVNIVGKDTTVYDKFVIDNAAILRLPIPYLALSQYHLLLFARTRGLISSCLMWEHNSAAPACACCAVPYRVLCGSVGAPEYVVEANMKEGLCQA